ncbi:MAG: hypothetical protein NWF08_03470 [Candidatus Bathyarchaeota archaeon]|nr:hypothetical protein [Candidatus Bathyarchaeota archaeon]
MDNKNYLAVALSIVLALTPNLTVIHNGFMANVEAQMTPSESWGIFFGTEGDIEFTINHSGLAVRIMVPREFLDGYSENGTFFLNSTIIDDRYYYRVLDGLIHYPRRDYYPYNSYTIEIYSPEYSIFNPPQKIFMKDITAPQFAGDYTFTIYTANALNSSGLPDFSTAIVENVTLPVSMREDPSSVSGYIFDNSDFCNIAAEGIVYAREMNNGSLARAYVNSTTGFFNITGLYEGVYNLTASAGYCSATGYSYALSKYFQQNYTVSKGTNYEIGSFPLNRGARISGNITYLNASSTPNFPMRSIDDNAWFSRLGIGYLNYTVEAYDLMGNLVGEYYGSSPGDQTQDPYWINGTKYSGFGPRSRLLPKVYDLKFWVFGYVQNDLIRVTVSSYGENHTDKDVYLKSGGVITGIIRLPETPRYIESFTTGNNSGALLGGNILAEAMNIRGELRGLTVLNRTFANGTVFYADEDEIRFYILGFSDFYNSTYSGIWGKEDYGLDSGQYYIRVFLNGFEQLEDEAVTLSLGHNSTVVIEVLVGGIVKIIVESVNFNPATNKAHPVPWQFPGRFLRVWLGSFQRSVGNGEIFDLHTDDIPLIWPTTTYWYNVEESRVVIWYVGNNWPIDQIIFNGAIPNAVANGTYGLRGHTYGHVQVKGSSVSIELSPIFEIGAHWQIVTGTIWLQRGAGIEGFVYFMQNGLNVPLNEKTFITINIETKKGQSLGAQIGAIEAGAYFTEFSIFGFYNWSMNTAYQIPDHFYYVTPSGNRMIDYGLDAGTYYIAVEDFGFDSRFTQIEGNVKVHFQSIHEKISLSLEVEKMGLIYGNVYGYTMMAEVVPLSWVHVASSDHSTTSLDGEFRLFLLGGTHTIDFSIPGYSPEGQIVSIHNGGELGLIVVLDQSGLPFPSSFIEVSPNLLTINIHAATSNEKGTEYVFVSYIDPTLIEPESVQIEWNSDKGTLNSTKGSCVCWSIPIEISSENCSLTSRASIPEYGVIEKRFVLNPVNVPEFSSIALIMLVFMASIIISLAMIKRKSCLSNKIKIFH